MHAHQLEYALSRTVPCVLSKIKRRGKRLRVVGLGNFYNGMGLPTTIERRKAWKR
jgi:hypothetical protein